MTSVLGLAHYYIWRRLVRDAQLPRHLHRTLSTLLVIFLLSQPATFIVMRDVPQQTLQPWAFFTFAWMGILSSLFALLTLNDLGAKLVGLIKRALSGKRESGATLEAMDPTRRVTLGRLVAGSVAFGATALSGAAVAQARGFRLEELEIELKKLPPAFDGFKIIQLSDIHVGPTIGRTFIESIVHHTNQQRPDLIAITGDLVDGSVSHLSHHTSPLQALQATHGTYFVTGNHEYYSGADEWIDELRRLGIPTLRNEAIRIERDGQSLLIAGVTDFRAGRYGDAPDLKQALTTRRPGEEVVLLAHQPRALTEAAEHDVGLQLSGHTHGGQFWPWNWVIHLIEPVVAGWAQLKRTQIYVSSGTGYWGPPMRLGTEAEITLVTLRTESR